MRAGGEEVLLVPNRAFLESEQVGEPRLGEAAFLGIRDVLLYRCAELLAGSARLLVLDDSRAAANHLGKRPEGDAVAVGETAPRVPPDVAREPVDVLLELPREAGLSDAADADDRDEMRSTVLGRCVVELLDEPELAVAPDERRLEPRRTSRSADAGRPR